LFGVLPRLLRPGGTGGGSIDDLRGVCIPEGVDWPLKLRLVGAGLADPDGVLGLDIVLPKADIPVFPFTFVMVEPTDKRDGRGVFVVDDVLPSLRCGIRDGVVSSVLSSDRFEPWCDGGFEPALLAGLELGFDPFLDPPGVSPVLFGVYDGFLGVYLPPAPRLLSLSLNESGVDADSDDRDGRDIATDRTDLSRTFVIGP